MTTSLGLPRWCTTSRCTSQISTIARWSITPSRTRWASVYSEPTAGAQVHDRVTARSVRGVSRLGLERAPLSGRDMNSTQRIVGIAGSLRRQSLNRSLLRASQELAPRGMAIEIFDRLHEFPPYDEDVRELGRPDPVDALTEAIRASDGLLVVTPEYNYSVPGV